MLKTVDEVGVAEGVTDALADAVGVVDGAALALGRAVAVEVGDDVALAVALALAFGVALTDAAGVAAIRTATFGSQIGSTSVLASCVCVSSVVALSVAHT